MILSELLGGMKEKNDTFSPHKYNNIYMKKEKVSFFLSV